MTEAEVKSQFKADFEKYKAGELSGQDFAEKTKTLLYDVVYDNKLEIKESGLITSMEMAEELRDIAKDSEDYNLVFNPIEAFLNETSS